VIKPPAWIGTVPRLRSVRRLKRLPELRSMKVSSNSTNARSKEYGDRYPLHDEIWRHDMVQPPAELEPRMAKNAEEP
jgi:hypothetical protein